MGNNMIMKTGASSLSEYGAAAALHMMLTPELEAELVARYKTEGCLDAYHQIIHAHLRYVMTIAKQLGGSRDDREDLIQEGMVGLMIALQKFEIGQGFRLAVYATHWIKSHIKQYMIDTTRIFRIATTKAQRKCYYNLRTFKKEGRVFNQSEVEAIALELNVTEVDVREMERKLIGVDLSINMDPEHNADLLNSLFSEFDDPAYLVEQADWEEKTSLKLQEAISGLDVRSRHIINDRWFVKDAKTLHELGAIHNVSHERIRQLETKSIQTIKQSMRQMAA